MKFLAVFLLVGFACAYAVPLPSFSDALDDIDDEDLKDLLDQFANDNNKQPEYEQKLREIFEDLLENVKGAIEKGNVIKKDVIEKLKEVRKEIEEKRIQISDKAKELVKKIKENAKDYLRILLEKLGLNKRAIDEHTQEFLTEDEEEIDRLKESFDQLLEKIKDAIDHGKQVKEETILKLKDIVEHLKKFHVELKIKFKKIVENLKDRTKDYFKKLWERLGMKKRAAIYHSDEALDQVFSVEEDTQSEMIKNLRESLDKILQRIKDALDKGESLNDLLTKLKTIREKLTDLNLDLGNKARELLEKIKEKANDFWQKLLDRLGNKQKRDSKLREMFRKLKDLITKPFDILDIKPKIEKIFGERSLIGSRIISTLKEKGGQKKILDLIKRMLGKEGKQQSLSDYYQKIKDYFKELNIELKEKFTKFGDWVKNTLGERVDKGKTQLENLKKIAREFIHDTTLISKEVANQALEFMREYKDELGSLFNEFAEKAKKILDKKEN